MRQPVVVAVALFGVLTAVVTYGANELLNFFLKQTFGIGKSQAGAFTAAWGTGMIVGGVSCGRLVDRWGHKRATLLAVVMAALAVAGLAQIQSLATAWALVVLFGVAYGFYETVFLALAMSVCQPGISASMYAILMAGSNIGAAVGLFASGTFADLPSLGFRGALLLLAAGNALVLASVPLIWPARARAPVALAEAPNEKAAA